MFNEKSLYSVIYEALLRVGIRILKLLLPVRKRIWLIACGSNRWGDNAKALWQYLNKHHPEIEAIAVLKNNIDIPTNRGLTVKKNSLKNIYLVIQAEALLTTHALSDTGPRDLAVAVDNKKIRLQHGVIGIKRMPVADKRYKQFDMICASSSKEKAIMVEEMKLDAEQVCVTGLARHDQLKRKNQSDQKAGILYLPTVRDWATSMGEEEYCRLLFNWVKQYCETVDKKSITVWVHPNWHKAGIYFSGLKNVNKIDYKEDLQDLLVTSEVFVTDYSSVAFDASLAGVPVVFYQPDRQEYIEKRGLYKEFVNDKRRLVIENDSALVEAIDLLLNDNAYREKRIREDLAWAKRYVETFDGNSCERIFRGINSLVQTVKFESIRK